MNRRGFIKTSLGGLLAAAVVPGARAVIPTVQDDWWGPSVIGTIGQRSGLRAVGEFDGGNEVWFSVPMDPYYYYASDVGVIEIDSPSHDTVPVHDFPVLGKYKKANEDDE